MEQGEDKINNQFTISFRIPKDEAFEENKKEYQDETLELKANFYLNELNPNILNLKEYFLRNYGEKYPYCKCQLSVFYKMDNKYLLLSEDEKTKLTHKELYLIKIKPQCDCENKKYIEYMNRSKYDIIAELTEEIKKLKKTEEIKNLNKAKVEDFYDIIIDINSIKKVDKEGWKIKYSKTGFSKYEQYKDKDLLKIGVLGNTNKGKSFILSKISKIKLLTGTSIQTKGLSVKYPDLKGYTARQLILLDSAGLETPVLISEKKEKINENKNQDDIEEQEEKKEEQKQEKLEEIEEKDKEIKQNEEFKENARDKIVTELFLQSLIINFSDILLIVVGQLTYSEQLLINKIKIEAKKQNKGRIIIIHNLQDLRTKEQVQDYIKNTLLKCSTFNLKKRTNIDTQKDKEEGKEDNQNDVNIINKEDNEYNNNEEDKKENREEKNRNKLNDVYYTEIFKYSDGKKLEIFHLIIANEDSEAGIFYNDYAYNFIEKAYNLVDINKFDVFEQVKNKFKILASNFLIGDTKNMEFIEEEIEENEAIEKIMKLKLGENEEISLKKCYTDELGFSLFKTDKFEPKYNYFKPDERTLEIRLEIPGNCKCSAIHKVIGEETIITIKGKKNRDKTPKLEDDLYDIREYTEFELNIPLKVEEFKIQSEKPKDEYPKFINGVCLIQYELTPKAVEAEGGAEAKEL